MPPICLTARLTGPGRPPGQLSLFAYKFDKREVLVGRDPAVDIRLPDPAVSLVHLRLVRRRGRLLVADLGSTNGTRLDGVRLAADEIVAVEEGACLSVGPFELRVGEGPGAEAMATGPGDTAAFARQMVAEILGGADGPRLRVRNGPDAGAELAVTPGAGPQLIGRGEDCALRLADADASRHHASVAHESGRVVVRDLQSKNGVEINGARIDGAHALSSTDRIRIGSTMLELDDPTDSVLDQLALELPPRAAADSTGALPSAAPGGAGTAAVDTAAVDDEHRPRGGQTTPTVAEHAADWHGPAAGRSPATVRSRGELALLALAVVLVVAAAAGILYLVLGG